jgi:hypothetical protein
MNLTTQWLVDHLSLARRQARLSLWMACVCMLGLFALLCVSLTTPAAKGVSQEPVVALAMEHAMTLEAEVADAEERRQPEAMIRFTVGLRHDQPSSPALMPDDWCGPVRLRPPISAV